MTHAIKSLFIIEYVGGGGMMNQPIPPSLLREGDAMLTALITALAKHQKQQNLIIHYSRDGGLPPLNIPHANTNAHAIHVHGNPFDQWNILCKNYDALLPIAPDDALGKMADLPCPKILLSDKKSLTIAASKTKSFHHLKDKIKMIEVRQSHETLNGKMVVKPDQGAGCQFNFFFNNEQEFQKWQKPDENNVWIKTPFIEGEHLSLSLFCKGKKAQLIAVNRQHITFDETGRMHLAGIDCAIPIAPSLKQHAQKLSAQMASHFNFKGMVGIDVIASQGGLYVADINPRLTTSCVALEQKTGFDWAGDYLSL